MSPEAGNLLVEEVQPRLKSCIGNAVPIMFPDDAQEIVADGVCLAARAMHQAEQHGKRIVKSPTRANGRYL